MLSLETGRLGILDDVGSREKGLAQIVEGTLRRANNECYGEV